MHKKVLSLILSLCMFVACTPSVSASNTADTFDAELHIFKSTDGTYHIAESSTLLTRSSNTITVYPKEGTDIYYNDHAGYFMRVRNDCLLEAELISIDPYDADGFSAIADECGFSTIVKEDVQKCIDLFKQGQAIPSDDIKVYLPKAADPMASSQTISRRTYTGYNNATYYEELVFFKGTSNLVAVQNPQKYTIADYLTNSFCSAATTAAGAILDYYSNGAWTIASVLYPQGIPSDVISTTLAFSHQTALMENKSRKYTWVVRDGEYFIGSILDYTTDYHFQDFLVVPGERYEDEGLTPRQYAKVNGYDIADQIAYKNYLYSTYTETISQYTYTNKTQNVTMYFSTLFP